MHYWDTLNVLINMYFIYGGIAKSDHKEGKISFIKDYFLIIIAESRFKMNEIMLAGLSNGNDFGYLFDYILC